MGRRNRVDVDLLSDVAGRVCIVLAMPPIFYKCDTPFPYFFWREGTFAFGKLFGSYNNILVALN